MLTKHWLALSVELSALDTTKQANVTAPKDAVRLIHVKWLKG